MTAASPHSARATLARRAESAQEVWPENGRMDKLEILSMESTLGSRGRCAVCHVKAKLLGQEFCGQDCMRTQQNRVDYNLQLEKRHQKTPRPQDEDLPKKLRFRVPPPPVASLQPSVLGKKGSSPFNRQYNAPVAYECEEGSLSVEVIQALRSIPVPAQAEFFAARGLTQLSVDNDV